MTSAGVKPRAERRIVNPSRALRAGLRVSDGVQLEHVNLKVTNLDRARRFYDRFLPVSGFPRLPSDVPWWLGNRKGRMALRITVSHTVRVTRSTPHIPTDGVKNPISDHFAFRAPSPERVTAMEKALRRRGFTPVSSTDRLTAHGRSWCASNTWKNPDDNVLEIYLVTWCRVER